MSDQAWRGAPIICTEHESGPSLVYSDGTAYVLTLLEYVCWLVGWWSTERVAERYEGLRRLEKGESWPA